MSKMYIRYQAKAQSLFISRANKPGQDKSNAPAHDLLKIIVYPWFIRLIRANVNNIPGELDKTVYLCLIKYESAI